MRISSAILLGKTKFNLSIEFRINHQCVMLKWSCESYRVQPHGPRRLAWQLPAHETSLQAHSGLKNASG